MPSKSKAQARKMRQLYKEGKISLKTLHEFNKGVDLDKLPDRIGKKKEGAITTLSDLRDYRKKRYGR